jgi:hypothetical protein
LKRHEAGISAAFKRGVPATTLDSKIWVDAPERLKLTALV